MSESRRVALPAYLSRFRCLGGACEDNCCTAGWNIAIDMRTFARYQAANGEWGPRLRAAVKANPKRKASAEDFGRLKLDQHGGCPFFTDDGWCGLQRKLGEEWLSNVCVSYPRRTLVRDGQVERGATLSCPEIARLALLDRGAMEPTEIEEPKTTRVAFSGMLSSGSARDGAVRQLMAPIHRGCLELVRRPDVGIEARLLALGLALQRLRTWQRSSRSEIEAVFASYAADLPTIETELVALPFEPAVQLELLRELLVERLATGAAGHGPRFAACIGMLAQGLRIGLERVAGGEPVERYTTALAEVYEPFMRIRPHIAANFVQNQLWATAFPFGGRGVLDDYSLLIVRFALVRLLLVGAAAALGRLDESVVIDVIQPFERAVSHDPGFLRHVLTVLRRSRALNLAFLATLIASPSPSSTGLRST